MEKTNTTKTRTDKRQNKNKATKHAKIQRFHKQKNNLIKTKNKKSYNPLHTEKMAQLQIPRRRKLRNPQRK